MCPQGERKASTLCVLNRVKDINKCDEKVRRENPKEEIPTTNRKQEE